MVVNLGRHPIFCFCLSPRLHLEMDEKGELWGRKEERRKNYVNVFVIAPMGQ